MDWLSKQDYRKARVKVCANCVYSYEDNKQLRCGAMDNFDEDHRGNFVAPQCVCNFFAFPKKAKNGQK
jgi:hypothetical protein